MKRTPLLLSVVGACLLAVRPAQAQVTIGTDNDAYDNCFPFSCFPDGGIYEQQYFSSDFAPGAVFINSLTFYDDLPGDFGDQQFSVYLSTSDTFTNDPNANLGADNTLFYQGTLSGAIPASFTLTGIAPFAYDPSIGDLLMEVVVSGGNSASPPGFLEADDTGDAMQRLYEEFGPGSGNIDANGLVTTIDNAVGATTSTPEPATLGLLAIGLVGVYGIGRRRNGRAIAS